MDPAMPPSTSAAGEQQPYFPQIQQTAQIHGVPHPQQQQQQQQQQHQQQQVPPQSPAEDSSFNVIAWHTSYQSCQHYFVNHAQHSGLVQSVAAFVNIRLPFQSSAAPLVHIPPTPSPAAASPNTRSPFHHSSRIPSGFTSSQFFSRGPSVIAPTHAAVPFISLVPFVRRLVVTGFDNEGVMHGFFGDDWLKGVGPLQEVERRNYLFAAKSVGWAQVKAQYDILPDQTVPFLAPLSRVQLEEIEQSEKSWSEWLAMEDWMVGPRAPMMQQQYQPPPQHHHNHHQHHHRSTSTMSTDDQSHQHMHT